MALALTTLENNVFEIGSFDAKTHFAELLRKVQEGAVINISKKGKQVAVLQGKQAVQNTAALEAHRRIRARAKKFAPVTIEEIKELKEYGRKY